MFLVIVACFGYSISEVKVGRGDAPPLLSAQNSGVGNEFILYKVRTGAGFAGTGLNAFAGSGTDYMN